MSICLTFHTQQFGIIACDSRICSRDERGNFTPASGSALKFLPLGPRLVIGGSSNVDMRLDNQLFRAAREFAQSSECASFDDLARVVPDLIFGIWEAWPTKIPTGDLCVAVLGYDAEKRSVRVRAFEYNGHGDIIAREYEPGQPFSGSVRGDAGGMAERILQHMGASQTPEAARIAMQRVISEQARAYPTFFGEPAHFFQFEVE